MIRWMHYRFLYAAISGTIIIAGIFSLVKWGLKFGVDFTGGSLAEYRFEKTLSEETATKELGKVGIAVSSIQQAGQNTYIFRLPPVFQDQKTLVANTLEKVTGGKVEELSFETVGPTVGPDIVRKTLYAMIIAASAILLWVAYQFRSIRFGTSAVLAMFHDSLVTIGSYSLLSHFFGAEVDLLFVTALLTILSFSVHDTIIVYDRIRESQKGFAGSLNELANRAITETMVRSLNNTFTEIFMLTALALLGGTTIRWFAVTLLIGMTSGAYSSPFIAVPILVTWDEIVKKIKGY